AKINNVTLQFRSHGAFEIGRDLGIFTATDQAKLRNTCHFRREPNTTRAVDAARHYGFDERADIFVFNGTLVFAEARTISAKSHCLILKIALTALIADWAIKRVIDQQKFHHAFTGLLDHWRIGENFRYFAIWSRT